jgi:hypothetical protein
MGILVWYASWSILDFKAYEILFHFILIYVTFYFSFEREVYWVSNKSSLIIYKL